jgi:hypothetical protein
MVYNPAFKSLEETYFQGEYVGNYGGFVPAIVLVPPTPYPSPSMTSTPTPTPSPTP